MMTDAGSLAVLPFPGIGPVAFEIGPFAVRWYALAYIAGLVFASWYMKRLVETPRLWGQTRPSMTVAQIDEFFIWTVLGVVLGGRLGYVLFYKPWFYLTHPVDILRIWDGGMSFHGGFLGVVVACLFFGRRIGTSLDRMLDLGAASVPVGLGLGRLANFVNGELWGRPTDVPWAFVFPHDALQLPRHPSQLYEAVLEGLLLFLAVRIATHHYGALQHPGRASGIFALGYGLSRILVEWVREPDPFLGYFAGGLTMGMMLSLPLCAVGVWLLLRSRHDPA
ncbi:MAG: prolipoprotein diacylglyceryl transferase [Aestuariivirga sp.]|uniref:prolipoprotein diacylglyceryl transferase n=1 Tax=Aestuariivirga sp. TaxID=2650926 RepID=UPI0038D1BABF